MAITNPSSKFEKHQTLDFFYYDRFLVSFFKKKSMSAFSDIFENHLLHTLKSLYVFI